jgi:hypothetical protein
MLDGILALAADGREAGEPTDLLLDVLFYLSINVNQSVRVVNLLVTEFWNWR